MKKVYEKKIKYFTNVLAASKDEENDMQSEQRYNEIIKALETRLKNIS